jgi:hypothetical protein
MRALLLLPACLCLVAAAATPPEFSDLPYPELAPKLKPAAAAALTAPVDAPATAPDGIRRCAGADGSAVFTDRRCEELGAVDATAPSAVNADTRIFVRSCARTREALLDGLRDALDAQDANRVASYYHWTGMGNRAAYALMDRLYGFSQRPLVDVQLVTVAPPMATESPALAWYPYTPPDPAPSTPPPAPRPPTLIRVDQMHGYQDPSAEVTYFHLLANAGCWWITF